MGARSARSLLVHKARAHGSPKCDWPMSLATDTDATCGTGQRFGHSHEVACDPL